MIKSQRRSSRACFVLGLTACSALLLLVCGAPTGTVQPSGQVTGEQARDRAAEIIQSQHPEMSDVTPVEKEYIQGGSTFYSYTYVEISAQQIGDRIITSTRVIIIEIDKDTGEEFVSLSD